MCCNKNSSLSFCAQYVKDLSYDHFLCNLYAPAESRESVFRLLAFYLELSRSLMMSSSWSVSGPLAGLIRLQWWRECIEGKNRPHVLFPFIKEELDRETVKRDVLLSIIEAFEEGLEGITDWQHWHSIMIRTRGQIQCIIASILKVQDSKQLESISALAIACELVFMARSTRLLFQHGKKFFPEDFIRYYQPQRSEVTIKVDNKTFQEIKNVLIQKAHRYFIFGSKVGDLKQNQISLLFPTLLAKRDLRRMKNWNDLPAQRGVGDQIALFWAFAKNKVLAR